MSYVTFTVSIDTNRILYSRRFEVKKVGLSDKGDEKKRFYTIKAFRIARLRWCVYYITFST